jgi:hypothetical protein
MVLVLVASKHVRDPIPAKVVILNLDFFAMAVQLMGFDDRSGLCDRTGD